MAFTTSNVGEEAPKGSTQKRAAELANLVAAYTLNMSLTAAGITTATVTSKAKTANTLTFLINGVFKSLGASDNFWVLGVALSNTTVQASSWQKYILLVDGSGVATVQEGTQSIVSAATVTWQNIGAGGYYPLLSLLNAGKTVAGVLTIATDSTHTFIPGTTLFGAAGITATFIDGVDQTLLPLIGDATGRLIGVI